MRPIIATTTFYKSSEDVRFQLALQMLEAAREVDYKVIVVDGSPEPWVQAAFEERGAVVHREAVKGIGPSFRQAIQAALDDPEKAEAFILMQPEQAPLVLELCKAIGIVESRWGDLVLPRRESLDSYPQYQQYCEMRGNQIVGNLTGRPDLDIWFSPRVFNRCAAGFFLGYNGQSYCRNEDDEVVSYGDRWDSIFVPVARVLALPSLNFLRDPRVRSTLVRYEHPAELKAAESGDETMDRKRDQQLTELVQVMRTECGRLGLPRS